MTKRYELTSKQFSLIKPFLPGKDGDPGRSGNDNRAFVNGVIFTLRTNLGWKFLSPRYGKWKSVHARFVRWERKGIWEHVFKILSSDGSNLYRNRDSDLLAAYIGRNAVQENLGRRWRCKKGRHPLEGRRKYPRRQHDTLYSQPMC